MKRVDDQQWTTPAAKVIYFLFFFLMVLLLVTNESKAQAKWAAPKEADNLKNPFAGNATAVKEGKTLYMSYCSPCHGDKGRGDGVAAASLSTKPADHTSEGVQNETDGALFWMITEGHNPMPTYKQTLPENERWELVNYIRTLSRKPKKI